jgi:phosphoglycerate dehydrogenase-like enzyme
LNLESLRVLASFDLPERYMGQIRSVSPRVNVEKCVDKRKILDAIRGVEVLYAGLFDRDIFMAADKLRWIHSQRAGIDPFLFPEFVESDILLTNARGIHRTQVSEHAMCLMLAWSRRLHKFIGSQHEAKWSRYETDEVWRKTIGIIGLGEIGSEIASKAKCFNMKVLGLDVREVRPPQVDEIIRPEKLPSLLRRSDYVVLAAPLTPTTRGLIGEKELKQMKRTAVLMNISRGGLVREEELVEALKERRIAGAALDVFETEPLPPDSELWKMDNVIVTPHVAGTTPHYDRRATPIFRKNLKRYIEGKPLINLVDKERGY